MHAFYTQCKGLNLEVDSKVGNPKTKYGPITKYPKNSDIEQLWALN
jgi:hypothetical protein